VEAWLKRVHKEADFNATYAAWMATLPQPGEIFTPEGMTEQEISYRVATWCGSPRPPSVDAMLIDHSHDTENITCVPVGRLAGRCCPARPGS